MLTPESVVKTLHVPLDHVQMILPPLIQALANEEITGALTLCGAVATIGVETPAFWPTMEKRADPTKGPRQAQLYAMQERYWHTGYYGRGLIQLTWPKNYLIYGKRTGLDLLAHPELLEQPGPSCQVLGAFFKDNHVAAACEAKDWPLARHLVNGGQDQLDRFKAYALALMKEY